MAQLLFHYSVVVLLFVILGRSSGSRMLESLPPTSIAPADAEAFGSMPSPSPSYETTALMTHILKHHSADKSVAGGDVILGGFATALVAAIACYIRVTRRSKRSHTSDDIV